MGRPEGKATGYLWLFKLKLSKIKNLVPWLHWPHFRAHSHMLLIAITRDKMYISIITDFPISAALELFLNNFYCSLISYYFIVILLEL